MRHRPVDSWSRVALITAAAIVLAACSSADERGVEIIEMLGGSLAPTA